MPRHLPRPRYPELAEAFYVRQVRRFLRPLDALIRRHVLPVVNRYRAPAERRDGLRLDDIEDDLVIALGRVRAEWLRIMDTGKFTDQATVAAKRINKANAADQARVLRGVAVVDLFRSESYLAEQLPGWLDENTSLIVRGGVVRGRLVRPLWDTEIDKIGQIARDGFKGGVRHEQLAKQIRGELGVGRKRATLIARDQTNKLNGQLTQARQRSVGFTHYVWSSAQDRRVRQEHADLHGRIFTWNNPPPVGHPGEPIQCRCVAIPHNPAGDVKPGQVQQTAAEQQAARQAASSSATAGQQLDKVKAEVADLDGKAQRIYWRAANGLDALTRADRVAEQGLGWPPARQLAQTAKAQIPGAASAARLTIKRGERVTELAARIAKLEATEAGAAEALELVAEVRGELGSLQAFDELLAGQLDDIAEAAEQITNKLSKAPALVRDEQVRILIGKVADHRESLKAMRQIPAKIRERLAAQGVRQDLVLGNVTRHPQLERLKGVQPRGWTAGKTWEDVDGVYTHKERMAVTASDGRTTTGQRSTVAGHEYGHAVDFNFQNGGALSRKERFRKAYRETLKTDAFKAMRPGTKSYLTQAGDAGPEEAFAEFFGRFYADGGQGRTGWRKDFPIMARYFRQLEKAAKAGDRFDTAAAMRLDAATWCCPEAAAIWRELAAQGIARRRPEGPGVIGDVADDTTAG